MTNANVGLPPDAVAEELKRFQGSWRQIAWEKDGDPYPREEQGWEPRLTIVGNSFVVTLADGSVAINGTFKLDPTRQPKTIDWSDTFGADAGKTFPAIYSLENDRLIFCAADAGQERPTEFVTKRGQVMRVSRREIV